MRLSNDDLLHELKLRLASEKSLKKKVLLKELMELIKQL